MVEEKNEPREMTLHRSLPWLELFRGFQVAFDFRKLLLAAGGILCMAFGWWLLAVIFYSSAKPEWPGNYRAQNGDDDDKAWAEFKTDRGRWNLMHRVAGPADAEEYIDASDKADDRTEYEAIKQELQDVEAKKKTVSDLSPKALDVYDHRRYHWTKPAGELRTWPWFEDRGPNPYLLVVDPGVRARYAPREAPSAWVHLGRSLVEPLVKFLKPVLLLLHPDTGPKAGIYLFLVIVWTLLVWALFGGAITRMAAVEAARREKIGMVEALRFVVLRTPDHGPRFVSFLMAPLFPILLVALIVILLIIFGLFEMLPVFGDIFVAGLGYPLVLIAGLVMALVLVGLVGWPLMSATISTEGTDSWEAVSRSYSYVFQAPWHYLWYGLVAVAYGAVLVFFVGFMGSLLVYLGKWGLEQTPFMRTANREPYYLYAYAPQSYQWRELLLRGGHAAGKQGGEELVSNGTINEAAYRQYVDSMTFYNKVGAFLVAIWLYLLFLMILGFAYSYFWSASNIIYLLMRRKVDDAELDEVYLEDDDQDDFYKESPKAAGTAAAPASTTGGPVTMVEPPSLRMPTPSATSPHAPPTQPGSAPSGAPLTSVQAQPQVPPSEPTPPSGDGNPPPP
jgi:hypothetical protein